MPADQPAREIGEQRLGSCPDRVRRDAVMNAPHLQIMVINIDSFTLDTNVINRATMR